MIKKLARTMLLLAGITLPALAAPILSITPSTNNVLVGQTFSLFLNVSSVVDLFGWEVNLDYGPAGLLTATSLTEGPFFGMSTSGIVGTIDNGTATILAMASSTTGFTGVTGSGVLAQIFFTAATVGTATVSISNIQLLDSYLDSIFPDSPLSATVNITGNNTAIPEPSTFVLLSLGLAFGAAIRRRV